MNELALFAGAGGGILAGKLLGWRCVCAVEIEEYPRSVLIERQNDGSLEPFPIWDDVRTFDGKSWRGIVDVVSGGFPCQDVAVGSRTKTGLSGDRSGLWVEMARIIREIRARFVFVENSAALTSRGLGYVLGDLAEMGFNARWGVLGAYHAGMPHERERIWIVANSDEVMGAERARAIEQSGQSPYVSRIDGNGAEDRRGMWVAMATEIHREDDGLAAKVDRTEALGNGQVPRVAALAWEILGENSQEQVREASPDSTCSNHGIRQRLTNIHG